MSREVLTALAAGVDAVAVAADAVDATIAIRVRKRERKALRRRKYPLRQWNR